MLIYLVSIFSFSWKVLRAQAKDNNFVVKETTKIQVLPQDVSAYKECLVC